MSWMLAHQWPLNAPFRRNETKWQGDKSGEYRACGSMVIWCTDKISFTDNAMCSHALLCTRNHFPASDNSGQWRRMPSCFFLHISVSWYCHICLHACCLFFVSDYYICPTCCNFSVCVYCLIPKQCNIFLFMHWFECVHTICLSFLCLGICILSTANLYKLYFVLLLLFLLLLLLLSLSPLYRVFSRMSLRQTMSLGDTLLQLLFHFIVNTVYGAYLPRFYVGSDDLLCHHFPENVCSA